MRMEIIVLVFFLAFLLYIYIYIVVRCFVVRCCWMYSVVIVLGVITYSSKDL